MAAGREGISLPLMEPSNIGLRYLFASANYGTREGEQGVTMLGAIYATPPSIGLKETSLEVSLLD
jgi:hypothetical protein